MSRGLGQALLLLGAAIHTGIAVFHLFFPRIFRWREELRRLSPANRGIVQVLNLCLTLFFLFVAYLSAAQPENLLTTALGRSLLIGVSLFWVFRAAVHPLYFTIRHRLSILLLTIFVATAALYAWLAWSAASTS